MARYPRFVGAQEIGRMLGVNRQRVNQLAALPDFPEPVQVLAMGKVWAAPDVERWAKRRGRVIHEY
jgi:predicted DNA-binding transcriptional regulator AlpA